jgi:hypothetical protein
VKIQYGGLDTTVRATHVDPIYISKRLYPITDEDLPFDSPEGRELERRLSQRDDLEPAQQRALDAIGVEYDDLERVVYDSLQSPR